MATPVKKFRNRKRNTTYTILRSSSNRRLTFPLVFTGVLIFVGALSSALAAAHMANTRRELTQARNALVYQQELNIALRGQMTEPYTLDDIERIATGQLGMARPEPAQIIYIHVPRTHEAELNTDLNMLPQPQSMWTEIAAFFRGVANHIFGGE